jgi:glyoxylase-like metal-dependent hydrolase (beta-lactamase superfamily II)
MEYYCICTAHGLQYAASRRFALRHHHWAPETALTAGAREYYCICPAHGLQYAASRRFALRHHHWAPETALTAGARFEHRLPSKEQQQIQ